MPDGLVVFGLQEGRHLRKIMDTLAIWEAEDIRLFRLSDQQGYGICFTVEDINVVEAVRTSINLLGGTLLCNTGRRG